MQGENIAISVVMPAYNAEKYIAEAIESILNQTFKNFEFIIIDDASCDRTWDLIHAYAQKDNRIIALKNETNLKLSKTLNKGIEHARGKYIARMDADDVSLKDRLQKQFEYMERHSDVGIVGGTMEIENSEGEIIGVRRYGLTDKQIRKKIYRYSPFCHPAIMMRRSILSLVGYYDNEWNPAEDYELYFRIGVRSKFANIEDIVLKYRMIPQSMTTGSTNTMYTKTIEIRKKYSSHPLYPMSLIDKIYNMIQIFLIYITSAHFKIRLFNFIRNTPS